MLCVWFSSTSPLSSLCCPSTLLSSCHSSCHQLHLPRCGGQSPCARQLMKTLAPLPSTTLSQMTDHSVWFIGWILPCCCERPVKNRSNLERKSYLDCSLDTLCTRGVNLEGWQNGCRHWGAGNDGRIGNLLENTRCKRSNISHNKWKIHISSRRWTNQNPLEEIRNWEHPPWYRNVQFKEKVT